MTTCCAFIVSAIVVGFFFDVEKNILAKKISMEAFCVSDRRRSDYQVFGFSRETNSGASRATLFMLHQKPQSFHSLSILVKEHI
jgi:hypothetical protein